MLKRAVLKRVRIAVELATIFSKAAIGAAAAKEPFVRKAEVGAFRSERQQRAHFDGRCELRKCLLPVT